MTRTVRRWITWTSVTVGVGLLVWGLIAASGTGSTGTLSSAPDSQDHVQGKLTASAVIVEYGDFQCPACGTYEPIIEQTMQQLGDKAALVFRNFPLRTVHQDAQIAAQAAEAANLQGKFWEFHNLLYDRQSSWPQALDAKQTMIDYAQELGLDAKKFTTDIDSQAVKDRIERDVATGNSSGLQGTPTFFVNGKLITNPASASAFVDAVNQIINAK